MHFTRMGGSTRTTSRSSCAATAATSRTRREALPRRARRPLLREHRLLVRRGDRPGRAEQMRELPFYTNWSYAHPRAIELAAEVASLAPGDLNRVFFCSGGSEAVESAWKLARQFYAAGRGRRGRRSRPDARRGRTSTQPRCVRRSAGTRPSRGTSRTTARPSARCRSTASRRSAAVRAARAEVRHVSNTNRYHRPPEETEAAVHALPARRARAGDPCRWARRRSASCTWSRSRTRAAAFTPPEGYWQGVREICDRYDILLSADEVITALRPRRALVRLRALRHPAGHRHDARRGSPRPTPRSARVSRPTA